MTLERRKEVLVATETWPGIEFAAWGTSNFLDALESTRSQRRSRIARQLAKESMSREVEAIGRGDITESFQVDAKGSGTATTLPNYNPLLEASLLKTVNTGNLVLTGGGTLFELQPGDLLTCGAAQLYLMRRAAAGSTNLPCYLVSGTVPISTIVTSSYLAGATVGTSAASAPFTANLAKAWLPTTKVLMQGTTTGAWVGGAPAAGEVLSFTTAVPGPVEGQAIFVSWASDILTFEWLWGKASPGGGVVSTTGKSIAFSATPAFAFTQGRYLSCRPLRGTLARVLVGCQANFTLRCVAGESGRFEFNLMGKPGAHDDVAFTGGTIPSIVAPRWIGGNASVEGIQIPFKSFEFESGNQLAMRQSAQASEGDISAMIAGREPRLRIQLEDTGKGGFDWHAKRASSQPVRMGLQLGNTAGNIISLVIPKGQVDEVEEDDVEGKATNSVTILPNAVTTAGDDEYVIGHMN